MKYFRLIQSTNRTLTVYEKTWPQWLALFLGVLTQPFFSYFRENGTINWGEAYSSPAFLIFSLIIATVLFPAVYRSSFDNQRPKFVQVIPIFTAGLGWETMIDSVISGVAKPSEDTTALIQALFPFG
ncbi:hypothetical protein [Ekhidna sp.]|uniref:hypothetical protein n=1 Tax=Ekhidna sp. TaxID=2608089 RepID=UPI0032EDA445